jgi:hypothetical protein
LQIALHEVAHVVLAHTGRRSHRERAFEREAAAEAWSFQRMQDVGIPVPEKARKRAEEYVAYRKRRGDRVIAAPRRPIGLSPGVSPDGFPAGAGNRLSP